MFGNTSRKIRYKSIIFLLMGLALLLVACQPQDTTPPADEAGLPVTGEEHTVTIADSAFQPADLTISTGSTVVWNQTSDLPHTVTAEDASFNSGTLQNGDAFSHTFTQAGQYGYYCEIHGGPGGTGMSGVINVTD